MGIFSKEPKEVWVVFGEKAGRNEIRIMGVFDTEIGARNAYQQAKEQEAEVEVEKKSGESEVRYKYISYQRTEYGSQNLDHFIYRG